MSISSAWAVTFREIVVELGIQFQDENKTSRKVQFNSKRLVQKWPTKRQSLKVIRKAMTEWKVPGLVIGVIRDDANVTTAISFVPAPTQYAEPHSPNIELWLARIPDESATADTLFDCASTAKSFTAAAVALLLHDCDKFPDTK